MARTTAGAVRNLLLSDYNGTADLTPYINTANSIVSRVATCASEKGYSLSIDEKELMERWLSAHFYAMVDQPYAERDTQKAKAVFQGRTGMYFEATKYGQTAISLDASGCLSEMGKTKVPNIAWLGKPPSTQTDYEDRD